MCRLIPLALLFVVAQAAVAAEADDFVKDVLRAVAKDTATLKKQNVSIIKASGTMIVNEEKIPTIRTIQAIWPSQTLIYFEMGKAPEKKSITVCVVNDRGWQKPSGAPAALDLTLEQMNDCRQSTYAYWMMTLLPLLESGNKIAFTPGIKVSGEAMTSITVARRGWPDVTMSFDPNTFLLRKLSYKGRDNGVIKLHEMFLGDHKEADGIKLPQTVQFLMDGKEMFSWTKFDYVFPDKLDRALFDRP